MDAIAAPRRLHAHVVDALVPMIVNGELAPGSLLPTEPEMSTRFGVSRSVVREALRVLGAKGLIEVRHGSGTRVTLPERWDPLDPLVLSALREALATMRAALDDPPRFVTGDSAFHLTLLRAARNRVLERMTQPMHELLSYAQALTDAIPGVLSRALAEHEAIAGAVVRRDAAGAREAMRVHLAHTQRDVIAITEAP